MNYNNINKKGIINAAILSIVLMFVFGLSHRILTNMLLYPEEMPPIDPNALAKFPMEIGEWSGIDIPLDEAIIERTNTDALINRNYSRNSGMEAVALYVAFGQRARDLMPHRPEVCYVGAGWTRDSKNSVELSIEGGMKLPCTIMQFSRGTLIKNNIMVLDYYIVDGTLSSDIKYLRSKIWKGSGAVKYTAQVQISAPILSGMAPERTREIITSFAIESSPLLVELLAGFNNKDQELVGSSDPNNLSEESGSDK